MTKLESVYFDLCRIIASLLVLVGHVCLLWPGTLTFHDWGRYRVDAFLILSGFVISYVADTKETEAKSFLISRAARIYSVAVVAIFLTILCDEIGRRFGDSTIYAKYHYDWPAVRIAGALTFSSELWFLSIQPFTDGPYWQLCYEVWYYIIFAAVFYLRDTRRFIVASVLILIAGPKIISMFPMWLMGVGLYHYKKILPGWAAALAYLASVAAIAIFISLHVENEISFHMQSWLGTHYYRLFEYAQNFPADYVFGALFALNFFTVRTFAKFVAVPSPLSNAIRASAGSTFSIYLYHYPMLILFMSFFKPTTHNAVLAIVVVTAACVALSCFTERKKHAWANLFNILANMRLGRLEPAKSM